MRNLSKQKKKYTSPTIAVCLVQHQANLLGNSKPDYTGVYGMVEEVGKTHQRTC